MTSKIVPQEWIQAIALNPSASLCCNPHGGLASTMADGYWERLSKADIIHISFGIFQKHFDSHLFTYSTLKAWERFFVKLQTSDTLFSPTSEKLTQLIHAILRVIKAPEQDPFKNTSIPTSHVNRRWVEQWRKMTHLLSLPEMQKWMPPDSLIVINGRLSLIHCLIQKLSSPINSEELIWNISRQLQRNEWMLSHLEMAHEALVMVEASDMYKNDVEIKSILHKFMSFSTDTDIFQVAFEKSLAKAQFRYLFQQELLPALIHLKSLTEKIPYSKGALQKSNAQGTHFVRETTALAQQLFDAFQGGETVEHLLKEAVKLLNACKTKILRYETVLKDYFDYRSKECIEGWPFYFKLYAEYLNGCYKHDNFQNHLQFLELFLVIKNLAEKLSCWSFIGPRFTSTLTSFKNIDPTSFLNHFKTDCSELPQMLQAYKHQKQALKDLLHTLETCKLQVENTSLPEIESLIHCYLNQEIDSKAFFEEFQHHYKG